MKAIMPQRHHVAYTRQFLLIRVYLTLRDTAIGGQLAMVYLILTKPLNQLNLFELSEAIFVKAKWRKKQF